MLQAVRQARGVAVFAHPSVYQSMELVRQLAPSGLIDGIEVYHPRNKPEDQQELLELCRQHDLIVTGGTDFTQRSTVPQGKPAGHLRDRRGKPEKIVCARKRTCRRPLNLIQ